MDVCHREDTTLSDTLMHCHLDLDLILKTMKVILYEYIILYRCILLASHILFNA